MLLSVMNHDTYSYYQSWLELINPIAWLDFISSIIRFNLKSSSLWFYWNISSLWYNLITLDQLLFPSTPSVRCWKTLPITFQRIILVIPRPHVKYTRTIYPYITGSFNYSNHGWTREDVLPNLDLVSHYLPSEQSLL